MIKNKYIKKLIIGAFCIVFVMMSVATGIMANNVLHTENCHIHNCSECLFIHMSTEYIKNIGLISIDILMLIVMLPLIQLINKKIQKARKLTLVELKVVQIK